MLLAMWICAAVGCDGEAASPDPGLTPPEDAAIAADAGPSSASDGAVRSDASAAGPAIEAGTPPAESSDAAAAPSPDATTQADATQAGADASPPAEQRVLQATLVVKTGETFDGEGLRFTAGAALGDGSQSETQLPLFKLEPGARLINIVLGAPAADGIHTYGDAQLENIVWEDIGEDALTIKESGTVVLDGGSARDGTDKVFQINAPSTFRVSNFQARNAGKFIRQNGKTTFKVEVFIDRCDIADMDEAIFRTDSASSTVDMTNTRYSNIGEQLFIGVQPANITTASNTEY
jgi:pectate lyase C